MRTRKVLAVMMAMALLSGCVPVPSLYPLYTESEVVFESALVGLWVSEDGKAFAIFQPLGEQEDAYRVTYSANGEWSQYEGRLVRLGGSLFLDLYPEGNTVQHLLAPQAFLPLIRAHAFFKLDLVGDTLHVSYLDDEAVAKKLEAGEVSLAHSPADGNLVLAAPTEDLQSLVLRYDDDPEVFQELSTFHRQTR